MSDGYSFWSVRVVRSPRASRPSRPSRSSWASGPSWCSSESDVEGVSNVLRVLVVTPSQKCVNAGQSMSSSMCVDLIRKMIMV